LAQPGVVEKTFDNRVDRGFSRRRRVLNTNNKCAIILTETRARRTFLEGLDINNNGREKCDLNHWKNAAQPTKSVARPT
jgi:hypothetical protein